MTYQRLNSSFHVLKDERAKGSEMFVRCSHVMQPLLQTIKKRGEVLEREIRKEGEEKEYLRHKGSETEFKLCHVACES